MCSTSTLQYNPANCRNSLPSCGAKERVSVGHLPVLQLYEKIPIPAKRNYVRLIWRAKKKYHWSLFRAFMSITTDLVVASKSTISRFITVYTKLEKVSSTKRSNGRKSKLTGRNRQVLKRIVAENSRSHCQR